MSNTPSTTNNCGITSAITKFTSVIKSSIFHRSFSPPSQSDSSPSHLHESQRFDLLEENTVDEQNRGDTDTENHDDSENVYSDNVSSEYYDYYMESGTASLFSMLEKDLTLITKFNKVLSEYNITQSHVKTQLVNENGIKFKLTDFYSDEYRAFQHHIIRHINTEAFYSDTWYEVTEEDMEQMKPLMDELPCEEFDETDYHACVYCSKQFGIKKPEEESET